MAYWFRRLGACSALLLSSLFVSGVHAQGRPLACQFEASGGLKWERGEWRATRFVDKERFVLVLNSANLDAKSVRKPLGVEKGRDPSCTVTSWGAYSCSDESGGYLLFDSRINRGSVAQVFGGVMADLDYRDTLSVSPFTCQPF